MGNLLFIPSNSFCFASFTQPEELHSFHLLSPAHGSGTSHGAKHMPCGNKRCGPCGMPRKSSKSEETLLNEKYMLERGSRLNISEFANRGIHFIGIDSFYILAGNEALGFSAHTLLIAFF